MKKLNLKFRAYWIAIDIVICVTKIRSYIPKNRNFPYFVILPVFTPFLWYLFLLYIRFPQIKSQIWHVPQSNFSLYIHERLQTRFQTYFKEQGMWWKWVNFSSLPFSPVTTGEQCGMTKEENSDYIRSSVENPFQRLIDDGISNLCRDLAELRNQRNLK